MEGMPRVPMFAPELKYCSGTLPSSFGEQIRENFSRLIVDTDTVALLKKYFGQLTLIKHRFPMEGQDAIRISFSWMNKGMGTSNAITHEDINFELACVMYNIGVMHAAVAVNEPRIDVDSMKKAFTHFQCAAYPFQYIRDSLRVAKFSSDFDTPILNYYMQIVLAQAQECLLEKSLVDHRKNVVVAKIATHLRDMYKECRQHLDTSGLVDIIPSSKFKEWAKTSDTKCEMYEAIAMFHLGTLAEEEKKMGHRLAYFDLALAHINKALRHIEKDKRGRLKETLTFLYDIISGKQSNAKKENDFVYHDRVPKPDELTFVEGVELVRIVIFNTTDHSVIGNDLFSGLLPINVLKSLSMYSEEKAGFKRNIIDKVAAKDEELNDYIKSLQLEEINFDQKINGDVLPEMLLERSAAFNSQPDAFPELLEKLQKVGNCAIEADHKLNDLNNRLNAINSEELKSDEGFKAITNEMARITDHHVKARTNNAELQRALAAHSENLKVLSMPLSELNRRLSETAHEPGDSAESQHLQKMLDKTNEMSEQRRALIQRLSDSLDADDITAKCLVEKDEDNQELYEEEIKKHEEIAKLIELNLSAQDKILAALTKANADFADYRRKIVADNQRRMDQILALTAAYDVYVDVSQKAEEGLKFYSTLFSLIKSLSGAVEAIETAYEAEKSNREKEMLRQLEKRTVNIPPAKLSNDRQTPTQVFSNTDFSGTPLPEGRLRLKDCLEYYRAKIAQPQQLLAMKSAHALVPTNLNQDARASHIPMSYSQAMPKMPENINGTVGSKAPLQQHFGIVSWPDTHQLPEGHMLNQLPDPAVASIVGGISQQQYPVSTNPATSGAARTISYNQPSIPAVHPSAAFSNAPNFPHQSQTPAISGNLSALHAPNVPYIPDSRTIVPVSTAISNITHQPILHQTIPANFSATIASNTSLHQASNPTTPGTLPSSIVPNISHYSTQNMIAPANLGTANAPLMQTGQPVSLNNPGIHNIPDNVSSGSINQYQNIHNPSSTSPAIPFQTSFTAQQVPYMTHNAQLTRARQQIDHWNQFDSIPTASSTATSIDLPQPTLTKLSPWHQPLAASNVNAAYPYNTVGIGSNPPSGNTSMAELNQREMLQSHSNKPTNTMDLLSEPLNASLPTPLTPATQKCANTIENAPSIDSIINQSESTVTETESVHWIRSPQKIVENNQQQRPAVAVAPIMQAINDGVAAAAAATDATLSTMGLTEILSSQSTDDRMQSPTRMMKTQPESAEPTSTVGSTSNIRNVLDPQTFEVGEPDQIRLQKRQMRERFKTDGIAAELPPLDRMDPINCLDSHYWLKK